MVKDNLIDYCQKCLADTHISQYEDYISCTAHKWACQRFLDNIKEESENPDYAYVWDDTMAQNIIDWFKLLRHSKGVLAKKPIRLTLWEQFLLCQLYGWRRKDNGMRRFKKSFFEVGRKNAKSQIEAGVALYEASVTATKNGEVAEIYTAGTKREQSKIVFEEAKLMLQGSPLQPLFKVKRDSICHIKSGSTIKALSKQDGKSGDGTNPALLILDEYHQHPTTEFYDLALGSNTKEPLLMIITTAGMDLTLPCYTTEYQYCKKILNPNIDVNNDEYLIDICELDAEDYNNITNLSQERLWWKANPIRMSYQNGVEKIRGEYDIAKVQPEHMTAFLTKCMNIWVMQKNNGYMNMEKWKQCEIEEEPIDTKNMEVYVGLDLSAKLDLTSVAFIIPYQSNQTDSFQNPIVKYLVYSHSFIPNRERLLEHIQTDKMDYLDWERRGFLTVTDTPIVDQNVVIQYVIQVCKKHEWKIKYWCFDPANASKSMMDVSNMGYDVMEVYQSHKSLNESTQGFREQVYEGNIQYLPNPLLTYAMSNAVVRRNNGLIKIDKDATQKRIDPVDAVLAAFKLALYHEFDNAFESSIDAFLASDW